MWDLVGNPEDRFSHNKAHIHQRDSLPKSSMYCEKTCVFINTKNKGADQLACIRMPSQLCKQTILA